MIAIIIRRQEKTGSKVERASLWMLCKADTCGSQAELQTDKKAIEQITGDRLSFYSLASLSKKTRTDLLDGHPKQEKKNEGF